MRIDPATNKATGEVTADIGQFYGHLPFGAGSLWALGGKVTLTDTLLRIDTEEMVVAESIPLGFNGGMLAFDFDAIWISAPAEGKLVKFDPATGKLTEHLTDLPTPRWVATGFGSIWVGLHDSYPDIPPAGVPTVARVDPASGKVEALIMVGPNPLGAYISAGSAGMWVRAVVPFLAQIDVDTNAPVRAVRSEQGVGGALEIEGDLWVTSADFGTVWRLAIGS